MASSTPPTPFVSSPSKPPLGAGPTVTELEKHEAASEEPESTVSVQGALTDLLLGAFLPCVPVVLVTTLLLTLILYHRVNLDPGWELLQTPTTTSEISNPTFFNSTRQLESRGGDAAYYVRYNPATLAAIASWSGKIIPFLTSSSMAVIAFFAGRRILDATRNNRNDQLPTPHQMSILINLLKGSGASPLWDTFLYRWQNHEHLVQPIPLAFGALGFIVVLTLLIGGADTWFAVATKPLNVQLLTRHLTPVNTYTRNLNPNICGDNIWQERPCPSNPQTQCRYPCSIANWNFTSGGQVSSKEGISGAQEAAETLLGNSYTNLIQNTSYGPNSNNYGAQQYYFLGDANIGEALDFLANTTSVSTQCEMVTQDCKINSTGEGFSCFGYQSPSFTYSGQVGVDPKAATAPANMSMVGIQFFKDPGLQNPIGYGSNATDLFGAQNPINFLTWSKGYPPLDASSSMFAEMRKGNYLQLDHSGDYVFALNCSTTIYTTVYAWANGSILQGTQTQGFYPQLAPDTFGAIFSAPFAIDSSLGHLALEDAAALSAYKTTPQDVANKFADQFSSAAVALSAGIMIPATSLLEQTRNNAELLTRVPKVPLYFLVSLNALYAIYALIVTALVVFLTSPAEAQEVKARLTIDGLAAGLFEPGRNHDKGVKAIEELYTEHRPEKDKKANEGAIMRVGMRQTAEGGWVWVASGDRDVRKEWTKTAKDETGTETEGVTASMADNAADGGESGSASGTDHEVLRRIK